MFKKIALHLIFMLALGVFACSLVLFGSLAVSAQPAARSGNAVNDGPRPPPMEEMMSFVQLNAQQITVVRNILDSERQAMNALNESIRPQRDAIHQSTRKKLAATLSAEQLQRFDEWREANRPPRPQGDAARERPTATQKLQTR